ncbi:hypothetical protein Lepto7376_2347 [[Leptolyngbya] sp. PCC 7376]|uniref:cytochrome c oxidase assembly factor Coa1 family protein n=1 Tax=[Leptolyngbya] sp. PCC 7376 TaxID=111781 RepID=UPI00029F4DE3|nr:cytochrome c oxidase assembly factor Coa1 family protein [[Leptolyngbya] sp. PCC 7376]AFY38631.1 hypothetical protein Lepto7376_2347 [[Leptolyngbya] sp. PCC 7376]
MPKKKLLLIPIIVFSSIGGVIVFVGLIVWLVMSIIKSSQPFKMAIADLEASSEVSAVLGSDWEESWWVSGEVNISGDQGTACLAIPVSGTAEKGTAYVDAAKVQGTWQMNELTVAITDDASFAPKETITLVTPTEENRKVCSG